MSITGSDTAALGLLFSHSKTRQCAYGCIKDVGQNSHHIYWLLTRVGGRNPHFQLMSVFKKENVSVKLCWNPSLCVAYHLLSHGRQMIIDDSVWFCLFASLTICFSVSMTQTCLGLVPPTALPAACWSLVRRSLSQLVRPSAQRNISSLLYTSKKRSLMSWQATFPVYSRQVLSTGH